MRNLIAVLASIVLVGCGVTQAGVNQLNVDEAATESGALTSDNGRPYNARPVNARPVNARPYNGRAYNGRAYNGYAWNMTVIKGLSAVLLGSTRDSTFDTWFNTDAAGANISMKYLFRCAAPSGTSIRYVATTGVTYTWPGLLGLAPRWVTTDVTQVTAADTVIHKEEERVTGCLLGLTNSLANPVEISARGMAMTVGGTENTDFPNMEGGFFGNIFLDVPEQFSCSLLLAGTNCGYDYISPACPTQSGRTCAKSPASCGMTGAGACGTVCTGYGVNTGYTSCKGTNGKTYANVFVTRIKQWCGDKYCNSNELCNPNCYDCTWSSSCGPIP